MITNTQTKGVSDTNEGNKDAVKQVFRKNLKEAMVARDMLQSELARDTGISKDMVSRYVKGRSLPNNSRLLLLARSLKIAESDLVPSRGNARTYDTGDAPVGIIMCEDDTTKSIVSCNVITTTDDAMKIMAFINKILQG